MNLKESDALGDIVILPMPTMRRRTIRLDADAFARQTMRNCVNWHALNRTTQLGLRAALSEIFPSTRHQRPLEPPRPQRSEQGPKAGNNAGALPTGTPPPLAKPISARGLAIAVGALFGRID